MYKENLYRKYTADSVEDYSDAINKLDKALKVFKNEEHEADYHTYLKNIAENNLVSVIKSNIWYKITDFVDIRKAQKWVSMMKQDDIDKRKKYEEKDAYIILTNALKEIIFTNDKGNFNIVDIYSGGYETFYWSIHCKYFNYKFVFQIPILNKLTVKNYDSVHEGRLAIYDSNTECIINIIKTSYMETEIKEALDKYVEKLGLDKKDKE